MSAPAQGRQLATPSPGPLDLAQAVKRKELQREASQRSLAHASSGRGHRPVPSDRSMGGGEGDLSDMRRAASERGLRELEESVGTLQREGEGDKVRRAALCLGLRRCAVPLLSSFLHCTVLDCTVL